MSKCPFIFAVALAPALAAIWGSAWFVTQDGPAHLYNAEILARSGDPGSPFRATYAVRWQPLPNWAGHVLDLGLVSILPARSAERAAATVTLAAFACAVGWLGTRGAAGRGGGSTAVIAALLGLNVTWLFGFTGFLLGAAMFAITLGIWWDGRDRMTWRRVVLLAGLVVVGYFCHPVSLGLTALGLVVLATLTPGRYARRLVLTALALTPLLPLGILYRGLTRAGGPMVPEWQYLARPFSIRAWLGQLAWVDPISLASKAYRPFGTEPSPLNGLVAPAPWMAVGLVLLIVATWRHRDRERRGWGVLAVLMLVGGLVGPDTIGATHGHYLPQRVVLLGLVALVPWLKLDQPGRIAGLGRVALVVALVLQSLFVWDYAIQSTRYMSRLARSSEAVGRGRRVALILLETRGRFRANPRLHADCLLGIGTGNVIWGNYETNHYYFPVQLRDPAHAPPASTLEQIARLDGPESSQERAALWAGWLERHHESVDVVVIVGPDAEIERITGRWFARKFIEAGVQVWHQAHK